MRTIKLNSLFDIVPDNFTGIIEWNDRKYYFIDGKQATKEAQELLCNLMKLKGLL